MTKHVKITIEFIATGGDADKAVNKRRIEQAMRETLKQGSFGYQLAEQRITNETDPTVSAEVSGS